MAQRNFIVDGALQGKNGIVEIAGDLKINGKILFDGGVEVYSGLTTETASEINVAELSLSNFADIDMTGIQDGQVLVYNSTTGKLEPGNAATTGGVTYLSLLTDVNVGGVTDGQALTWSASANKWIASSSAEIDLSAVDQHIVPATDITYDLGSADKRWRDLYLSGNTIYMDGTKISREAGTGDLVIADETDNLRGIKAKSLELDNPDVDPNEKTVMRKINGRMRFVHINKNTGAETIQSEVTVDGADVSVTVEAATQDNLGTVYGDMNVDLANTFLGKFAGNGTLTTGTNNTGVGHMALNQLTSGAYNVAVGRYSMERATEANRNTAIGQSSMARVTTGTHNVAVGYNTLLNNTTGVANVSVGTSSMFNNTTGGYNTAVGYNSLDSLTTGTSNTAIGHAALHELTTGIENIAIGHAAANQLADDSRRNIIIGIDAAQSHTAGENNIFIGYASSTEDKTGNGQIVIGNQYNTRLVIPGLGIDTNEAQDGQILVWNNTINKFEFKYPNENADGEVLFTKDLRGDYSVFREFLLNPNPEEDLAFAPYIVNDLAFARLRGATYSADASCNMNDDKFDAMFDGTANFFGFVLSGMTEAESCQFTFSVPKTLTYGAYFGIAFGAKGWATRGVRLEAYSQGEWKTVYYSEANPSDVIFEAIPNNGSTGTTQFRVKLWNPVHSGGTVRISHVFAYDYNSELATNLFIDRSGGDVYGGLNITGDVTVQGVLTAPNFQGTLNIQSVASPTGSVDFTDADIIVADASKIIDSSFGVMNLTFPVKSNQLTNGAMSTHMHDVLAFGGQNIDIVYENSTDNGTTWATAEVDMDIFSQKKASHNVIHDGTTYNASRWTFTGPGLEYSYGHTMILGHTWPGFDMAWYGDIIVESRDTSGSNLHDWVTRFEGYNLERNAEAAVYHIQSWGGDNEVRVTIRNTVGNTSRFKLSMMKFMTARAGDQGVGPEYQFPYAWDAYKNMTPGADINMLNGSMRLKAGSIDDLSLNFIGDADTGMYRPEWDQLNTVVAGNEVMSVRRDGVWIKSEYDTDPTTWKKVVTDTNIHSILDSLDRNALFLNGPSYNELRMTDLDHNTVARLYHNSDELYIQSGGIDQGMNSTGGAIRLSGVNNSDIASATIRHSGANREIVHTGNMNTLGIDAGYLGGKSPEDFVAQGEALDMQYKNLYRAIINSTPEGRMTLQPAFMNDIGYNRLRGGSVVSITNGTISDSQFDALFDAKASTWAFNASANDTEANAVVLEFSMCQEMWYSTTVGIGFGAEWNRAKGIKLEVFKKGEQTWQTVLYETNNSADVVAASVPSNGTGLTHMRVSLWAPASGSTLRVNTVFAVDFNSELGTGLFVDRTGGAVYGTITQTSDERLKTNITDIQNPLSKLSRLRGVDYTMTATGKDGVGFVAQEVEQVLPQLVETDEKTGFKSVAYSNMTGLLTEAVKELKGIVEAQAATIAAMQIEIDNLKNNP